MMILISLFSIEVRVNIVIGLMIDGLIKTIGLNKGPENWYDLYFFQNPEKRNKKNLPGPHRPYELAFNPYLTCYHAKDLPKPEEMTPK